MSSNNKDILVIWSKVNKKVKVNSKVKVDKKNVKSQPRVKLELRKSRKNDGIW